MQTDKTDELDLSDIAAPSSAGNKPPTELAKSEQKRLELDQQESLAELRLRFNSQELGILGKIFGSGRHAKANIAGITILFSVMAILYIGYNPIADKQMQSNIIELFKSVLMASIGFFLAAATEKNDP